MRIEKLHLENVSKALHGKPVLDRVNLHAYQGELHMVLGACGAGKTTLARIVAGQLQADSGRLYYGGRAGAIRSGWQSARQGIRSICARSSLVDDLTVKDNILLGKEPVWAGCFLSDRQAERHLRSVALRLGLTIDLQARAGSLRFAEKRLVEMMRLWYARCELIVLDDVGLERFSPEAIDVFRRITESIKGEGGSLLYFSQELDAMAAVAEEFSHLVEGRVESKSTVAPHGWMIQAHRQNQVPDRTEEPGECVLRVEQACTAQVAGISFQLHRGEVLGVTGTEEDCRAVAELLRGGARLRGGSMYVAGRAVKFHSPEDAIRQGIWSVFGGETSRYLIQGLDVQDQVTLPMLWRAGGALRVNRTAQRILTERCLQTAGVPCTPLNTWQSHEMVRMLLARCAWLNPRVILCHAVMLDVPQAQRLGIRAMIREMAAKGGALVFLSAEQQEVRSFCDNVLVLKGSGG